MESQRRTERPGVGETREGNEDTCMNVPAVLQRRSVTTLIKIVLLVVVGLFLGRTALNAYRRLSAEPIAWHDLRWGWLAASVVLYWAGLFPMFVYWRRILAALGQPTEWWNAYYAFSVGHLGKYVPGKAMVVMLRIGLLQNRTVPALPLSVSVVVETLTMMSVGSLVGAVLLAWQSSDQPWMLVGALGFLCLATLPTLPPVFRILVLRIARTPADRELLTTSIHRLNYSLLAQGWLLNAIGWTLMGLSLFSVMMGLNPPGDTIWRPHLLHWTGWVGMSVVAGFLSFLPGGMVVRDGILVELLREYFDPMRALGGALLLRASWLAGELIMAGLLFLVARRRGE